MGGGDVRECVPEMSICCEGRTAKALQGVSPMDSIRVQAPS